MSGLPIKNGNKHAGEIATFALNLLYHCGQFKIKHLPGIPLRLRIGRFYVLFEVVKKFFQIKLII